MVMIWFCELWHKLRVSVSLRRWLRFSETFPWEPFLVAKQPNSSWLFHVSPKLHKNQCFWTMFHSHCFAFRKFIKNNNDNKKKIILVSWIKLNWQIPDTQKKQCPVYKERVWLLWSDSWATGQAMPPKHILSNLVSQAGCGECKIFLFWKVKAVPREHRQALLPWQLLCLIPIEPLLLHYGIRGNF